jgi:intracellular multiplication protein IcmP
MKSFTGQLASARGANGNLLYPHLQVFGSLDLISMPLDHPTFGMALTARQFAFKHRLIAGWRSEGGDALAPVVDRQAAQWTFVEQLGKHWTESKHLSVAETLLVAVAMPRVVATDSSLSDEEFHRALEDSERMVAYCWAQFSAEDAAKSEAQTDFGWLQPDIDVEPAREVIRRYIGHSHVRAVLERHAFRRTVIVSLFQQARRIGVLQPAELRWLRFFDRALWYTLQSIGRQSPFPEAAGVIAHYLCELKCGEALLEPQVDKAGSALQMQLDSYRFVDADRKRYAAAEAVVSPI